MRLLLRNPRVVMSSVLDHLYSEGYLGRIPQKSLSSVFSGGEREIRLRCLDTDARGVSVSELCLLGWMAGHYAPTNIFEFGTADGRTTLNLALNSPNSSEIYTMDLPDEARLDYYQGELASLGEGSYKPSRESIGSCFRGHPVSQKIHQLLGDSRVYDFSPFLGKMDLIFIDANHAYDYVRSDTESALRMCSRRGVIVWHDYRAWEGVRACVDELHERGLNVFSVQGMNIACYIRADQQ